MSSEQIVYDEDIYDLTTVERNSVENVVYDSRLYIAYVQWHSGDSTIYAYQISPDKWKTFVDRVNALKSVGSALQRTEWGGSFENYVGWDTDFKKRLSSVQDIGSDVQHGEFEVTLNFTGSIKVTVDADNLTDAVSAAVKLFTNEATTGHIEVVEAKKVL